MFRLRALLIASAVVVSGPAWADHYGMAGCGLGSMVFKNKPGKIQILAGTTNGILGSQTFGLTSGTSGCVEDMNGDTAALYIRTNKEPLMQDISRGSGETLTGLAAMLGCSNVNEVGQVLQQNYESIFSRVDASSKELLNSIGSALKSNHATAKSCGMMG